VLEPALEQVLEPEQVLEQDPVTALAPDLLKSELA